MISCSLQTLKVLNLKTPKTLLKPQCSNPTRPNNQTKPDNPSETENPSIPTSDTQTLARFKSRHNQITVLQVSRAAVDHPLPGSRLLLLDTPGNIHSISFPYRHPSLPLPLSSCYYDVFATLPAVLEDGPVGVFGFGAGTVGRLVLEIYPGGTVHGWEIDPDVLYVAREYFDLGSVEKKWKDRLFVYVGDAFEAEIDNGFAGTVGKLVLEMYSSGTVNGWEIDLIVVSGAREYRFKRVERRWQDRLFVDVGKAFKVEIGNGGLGILVDLFSKGCLLPELQDPMTWRKMKGKLRKGGRVMVNVGGSCVEPEDKKRDGRLIMEETLEAMSEGFGGEISVLTLGNKNDDSSIALTGKLPEGDVWKKGLPKALRFYVDMWRPFTRLSKH